MYKKMLKSKDEGFKKAFPIFHIKAGFDAKIGIKKENKNVISISWRRQSCIPRSGVNCLLLTSGGELADRCWWRHVGWSDPTDLDIFLYTAPSANQKYYNPRCRPNNFEASLPLLLIERWEYR